MKKPRDLPTVPDGFRWTLLEMIGSGGQGSVWKVEDSTGVISPPCAMKILDSDRPLPQAKQRFHREIAAIKAIDHPNIINIVDHSQENRESPFPFLVMKYLEGALPLKEVLDSNSNPFAGNPVASIDLFIQLTDALLACEKARVVHRDISPSNVIIWGKESAVKLIDFGIAQIDDGELITVTGEALGTPYYRAPECDRGSEEEIGAWSDLYSAGKVLWSAITNREAFAREKPVFGNESMAARFPDDPDTWHLFDVYEKTIREDNNKRWQSAEEALREAKKIKYRITSGALPFEMLKRCCPVCRYEDPSEGPPVSIKGLEGVNTRRCGRCGFVTLRIPEWYDRVSTERRNLG